MSSIYILNNYRTIIRQHFFLHSPIILGNGNFIRVYKERKTRGDNHSRGWDCSISLAVSLETVLHFVHQGRLNSFVTCVYSLTRLQTTRAYNDALQILSSRMGTGSRDEEAEGLDSLEYNVISSSFGATVIGATWRNRSNCPRRHFASGERRTTGCNAITARFDYWRGHLLQFEPKQLMVVRSYLRLSVGG